MADATLGTMPADGKLPTTLPAYPDRTLALAWASEKHETVTAYELSGTTPNIVAIPVGRWVVNAPIINPYTGEAKPSQIPPQWRSVDSKSAFEINNNDASKRTWVPDPADKTKKKWTDNPGNNGMTDQPNWNWTPPQPKQKPNKLN